MNKSEKAEYFKIRLEHTIKHTQEMTRLVYLVNAGALTFAAFLWNKDYGAEILAPWITIISLTMLAVINYLLYLFIKRQSLHYRDLRISYWRIVEPNKNKEEESEPTPSRFAKYFSTDLIADIHLTLFWGIVIVLILLMFYFLGPVLCPCFCK